MHEVFRLSLIGASRRCDNTVIEQLISLDDSELSSLPVSERDFRECVNRVLSNKELGKIQRPDYGPGSPTRAELLGWQYVSLAVGLQRCVGHRVEHVQLEPREHSCEFHSVFEYECLDLGQNAIRLALAIIHEAFPGLEWPIEIQPPFEDFEVEWKAFQALAGKTILPADTECTIMAARRLGIPCVKLEREPYLGVEGDFRIRRNSMLKLGHCAHQLVLDGFLCINRSEALLGAYHDRLGLIQLSEIYGFTIPYNLNKYRSNNSYEEARKTAELLQYPVVAKSRRRSNGTRVCVDIQSSKQLEAAVGKILTDRSPLLLERYVEGSTFRVLFAGHSVIAVIANDGRDVTGDTDNSITATAAAIARGTGAGMLEVTVVTPHISRPLSTESGAVVDVDLSPRLDRFLKPGSDLMQRAVTEFLHWLYPVGAPGRIPVMAITGTNGKTTTSRMAAKILADSGLTTALCCTDGIYRNGELVTKLREIEGDSYLLQLDDPGVQAAVLETHFGRIARLGFPWQECDVGVCTNVTGDHVGRLGVETLEDMVALKRSVLDRARHVVLNADDPACMRMLPDLQDKRVTLTTLGSAHKLADFGHIGGLNSCSIEDLNGRDWIVLTEHGERQVVIAVDHIPATYNGAARHNVCNAQQAVVAARAAGVSVDAIARALAGFEMNIKDTPGRLNIHDNGRYKVIMDFAHNADGIERLAHFVDRLPVNGRRMISFSISMLASNDLITAAAAASAGHFDVYICWDSSDGKHRPTGEVPRLMRQSIEAQGVIPEAIRTINDEREALEHALALCGDGDLLVVQTDTGNFEDTWKSILRA